MVSYYLNQINMKNAGLKSITIKLKLIALVGCYS